MFYQPYIRDNPLKTIEIVNLGQLNYIDTYELQKKYVRLITEHREEPDRILCVIHEGVYTAGSKTEVEHILNPKLSVIATDRGGSITWHGPGQLVVYPIMRLSEPIDIPSYVRHLESALIKTCSEVGVNTGRIKGRSGVWVLKNASEIPSKIAAIGIKISKGVTYHGISLNCNPSLDFFSPIIPCGLDNAGVTSLSKELNSNIETHEVLPLLTKHLVHTFNQPKEHEFEFLNQ